MSALRLSVLTHAGWEGFSQTLRHEVLFLLSDVGLK